MPSPDVLGAHYVLQQSTPGHTHRLSELLDDAPADELTVRREIDALALDGQVKRLYVGEHVILKKTDEFDPENAPDVEAVDGTGRSGTLLDPETYELPHPRVLDPSECYSLPPVDELKPSDGPDVEETADD